MSNHPQEADPLTGTQWLICIIASIGFAFDIYELLMLPLILPPALQSLGGIDSPLSPEFARWRDLLFYVPAFCGGIFGMLGGYLTDRFGRRKVLVWSILLYAFSAFAAGFATSLEMLLFLRCTTFVGVCVEFVAAVAWLAELFPNPKQREAVLGYTQFFSSVGGLLVTVVNKLLVNYGDMLPAIYGAHEAWRYTLISGVLPALPLILVRPFLPESPAWAKKKAAGTLKRPSFAELFAPQYRMTTIITALLFACSYGAAFGALQQTTQIVKGMPQVKAQVESKTAELTEAADKAKIKRKIEQDNAANVNLYQEIGGLAGRFLLALLVVRIVSQRLLLRLFQVPGLIVVPLVYLYPAQDNLELLKYGMFLAGLLTVGQFSFWGNYLPRMYPVHLRGTGESFAANIGGRLIGTSAALLTSALQSIMPERNLGYAAATVGGLVFLVGLIGSFWLPEPPKEELPEE